MADLEYAVADGIGTILLNRPHRKNAFTLEMIDEWARILVGARTDPDVRVIVLTGAGDAFCSGVDLAARRTGRARARWSARRSSPTAFTASPTPWRTWTSR